MTTAEHSREFFVFSHLVHSSNTHCVKSVCIRSFSGPYSVQMRENMDQKNSEYGHFPRSGTKQLSKDFFGIQILPSESKDNTSKLQF